MANNMMYVAILAIVALVALVALTGGTEEINTEFVIEEDNMAGQAYRFRVAPSRYSSGHACGTNPNIQCK